MSQGLKLTTAQTVAEAFEAVARRHPQNECIRVPVRPSRHYLTDGLSLTYGGVLEQTLELREVYAGAGYGHGHRIALLLENRPDFVIHWLALNGLGASAVPLNPDYRVHELAFIAEKANVDLVISVDERLKDVQAAMQKVPNTPNVVGFKSGIRELPAATRPIPYPEAPNRQTESGLLFTSGTTGLPKGCVLDNEAFLFNGARYLAAGGVIAIEYGKERLYNPLPLYYANAFAISNIVMILSAGCMIFPDRFHPETYWQEIAETDATILHHLGIIPPILLKAPVRSIERKNRVKFSGGAGLDGEQRVQLEERFGFPFVEYYGMTEIGVCAADNIEPRQMHDRAIGRPWPGVDFRLVDSRGSTVPVGEVGELLVRRFGRDRRRGLCRGYLGDDEATRTVWRDGWFHTGDLMRCDEHGVYYFVDRKKEMIRRSGQNISPAEIEVVLAQHPSVVTCAALAVPDENRQEEVLACIVPSLDRDDKSKLAEDLLEWSFEHLAYFKAPGWLLFVSELPMTDTHKVKKALIFSEDEDPRARPGVFDVRERKKRQ